MIGEAFSDVHQELTSARPNLTLNREAFQQLLEAAYVIQQQNDRTHAKTQKGNSSRVLAEISETQRLIQSGQLDVPQAAELIVTRLHAVTAAIWAAVGIVEGTELRYFGADPRSNFSSEPITIGGSASSECLRTGLIKRYAEIPAGHEAFQDLKSRGIESFVSVPVYSEGAVAGVLVAGFPEPNGFDDQDVSACQLMAGLVTESIARAAELEWKPLAAERATMLETLERIKPQLERLVDPVAPAEAAEIHELDAEELIQATQDDSAPVLCRGCGNMIAEDEGFCGLCGLPSPAQKPSGDIQSKWASLWHMQQAQQADTKPETELTEYSDDSAITNEELLALKRSADRDLSAEVDSDPEDHEADALAIIPEQIDPVLAPPSPWTSATHAKQWLISLESGARKKAWLSSIRRQRANIYLGAAIVLLITAVAGWNSPGPGAKATATAPRLSLLDQTLIALNLAEAPPPAVHLGNPDTQVWVDTRTALYYCPGSDLYGKTAGGRVASQRDAQQDQFTPALRKACN